MLTKIINKIKLKKYIKNGLVVGKNFNIESRVHIDSGFSWLIEIGDNVTLAPEVMILAHDACMKKMNGLCSMSRVKIGNNVFVGAKSIILQGVTIGDNVIVGAGSVVSRSIPSDCVACGNPARPVKELKDFTDSKISDSKNTFSCSEYELRNIRKNITVRKQISEQIGHSRAYIAEKK